MVRKGDLEGAYDPLLALLRSAAHESVAPVVRDTIDAQFIYPLGRWLGGERAVQRAGLIAASLLGLAITRDVIRSQALTEGDDEALVALVAPGLQSYIDGTSIAALPS